MNICFFSNATNLVVTNISDESINPDYPVVGFLISSVHGMVILDDDEIEKIELYNRVDLFNCSNHLLLSFRSW